MCIHIPRGNKVLFKNNEHMQRMAGDSDTVRKEI